MFKYLITLACLLIWGTTSWISIKALASFLPQGGLIIYAMGAGLELGKLLIIIHIHRIWGDAGFVQKGYYCGLAGILILLTACEVLGFLSQGFSHSTSGHRADQAGLAALKSEKAILQDQVSIIENTLAGLPEGYVSKRVKIRETMGYDRKVERILEIAHKESGLAVKLAGDVKQAGPVYAVAEITGFNAGDAAIVFIAILVVVLELLSAGLAVAVSAAWGSVGARRAVPVPEIAQQTVQEPEGTHSVEPEPAPVLEDPEPDLVVDEGRHAVPLPEKMTNNGQLRAILDKHNLSARQIASITGRKRIETVKDWLAKKGPDIPDKALRQVLKYVRENPVRLVAEG